MQAPADCRVPPEETPDNRSDVDDVTKTKKIKRIEKTKRPYRYNPTKPNRCPHCNVVLCGGGIPMKVPYAEHMKSGRCKSGKPQSLKQRTLLPLQNVFRGNLENLDLEEHDAMSSNNSNDGTASSSSQDCKESD